jgi:PAS domain S-box-containing protein
MNAPQPVSSTPFTVTMRQIHNDLSPMDYDYKKIIEGLPTAVYVCDTEGRITFYNEASAELWGRRPVIGKDLWCGSWKIYRPDGSPMGLDECPMAIALKEGRPVKGVEIVVERPDGVRLNVLPHPKPIFNSYGKIVGAVNMLVDITAKKKAESEIRKSEEEYRLLSQSLAKKVEERTSFLQKS